MSATTPAEAAAIAAQTGVNRGNQSYGYSADGNQFTYGVGQQQIGAANQMVQTSPNQQTNAAFSNPSISGIVSSAQPIISQNQNSAITQATSRIINPTPSSQITTYGQPFTDMQGNSQTAKFDPTTGQSLQSTSQPAQLGSGYGNTINYLTGLVTNATGAAADSLNTSHNLTLQNAAIANQQLQLQYNTSLGGLNQQYNQAFQQLNTQHQNDMGSAVAQIATADPFGTNASSSNTQYVGKINDMYQQQAGFLTAAYNQQQVALQNGQASAALDIQKQINDSNAQFGQQIAGLQQGMASSLAGIAQFGQSRQLQSQGIFDQMLKSTNLSGVDANAPLADLQKQFPTVFSSGADAGFDPATVAQAIRQGTTATLSSQQAQERIALDQQRVGMEQYRLYAPIQIAGLVGSLAKPTDPSQLGQYYNQKIGYTASSPVAPSSDTTTKLTAYSNGLNLLPTLQATVNNADSHAFLSQLASYLPPSLAPKSSTFNAGVEAMASYIDNATGAKTGTGISKLLTAKQTPATKQAIVDVFKNALAQGALDTIDSAAAGSQRLSGYESIVPLATNYLSGAGSTQSSSALGGGLDANNFFATK